VTLGVMTVLMRKPADIASAHVATGALFLVTTFVLAVRSMRLYAPRRVGSALAGRLLSSRSNNRSAQADPTGASGVLA
ncbi:MAG: hypothetical protein ACREIT_11055, partial [Tepidisphaeraceae bacterium]